MSAARRSQPTPSRAGGRTRISGRSRRRALAGALVLLVAGPAALVALDLAFPFPERALHRPPGRIIRDREGAPLRIFLATDDRYRMPVGLEDVSPVLRRTVVASEDRWFRFHPGVNPLAIVRAALADLWAGEVVSGASTITMQVVRLAEPRPRTMVAKVTEALRALQLEAHHDKDEILEAYLNLAPFGGNIEGVGAAAWFYFGKDPDRLSLGEAALLTALPRAPVAYDPIRNPASAAAARARVLRQLRRQGAVGAREMADALRQPLPEALQPVPYRAPHLARRLHGSLPVTVSDVRTTIDPALQQIAASRLASRVAELRREGIGNGAAVVLDNDTREVRAWVGSADFFDDAHQGQVDSAAAPRSPGSTLKPFLYALAVDRGELVPDSILLDVPTDFSGYVAQNYDGEYRGPVTAGDALRQSLNAPAVRLLARVGLERFHALLLEGGLATLDRPAIHYGLPLVLGGGEVTLADLTDLYATLASGGMHAPLRVVASPTAGGAPAARRLLSREASWLVTRVLTDVTRPDLPDAWRLAVDVPAVAWKTGTSYGHRDAWAVGFSRRYTVGVWVGNPDGTPRKGISGARHAGPVLFDLFRALEGDGARLQQPRGLALAQVPVCPISHQLAGPFCPTPRSMEVVDGVTRLLPCQVHRRVFVDAESGLRLAGACLGRRPHESRVVEVRPPELVAWMRARNQPLPGMPPLSPACREIPADEALTILSPDAATPYLRRDETPDSYQGIPLTARAGVSVRRLYWYQDGELVASGAPEAPLFVSPRPGDHELVVVDDSGRSAVVRYRVESPDGSRAGR